jgi:hypothetical protein
MLDYSPGTFFERQSSAMGQPVACPNCQRKLSIRPDLEGKRVVCPSCKTAFFPGEANGDGAADADSLATESAVPGMEFLLSGAKPGTSEKRASGEKQPAKVESGSADRPKGKKKPLELYVAGGVIGAVLVIAMVCVIIWWPKREKVKEKESEKKGFAIAAVEKPKAVVPPPVKEEPPVTLYGLEEDKRKRLFYLLIKAVDKHGMSTACKKEWEAIFKEYGVDSETGLKILEEGFTKISRPGKSQWPQPDFDKANRSVQNPRRDWIKKRNEIRAEPILRDY